MRGKGSSHCQTGKRNWDHPRLCGEKIPQQYETGSKWGSPPPMRGKVTVQSDAVNHGRITPAYAGKSFSNFIFCSSC